MQFIAVVVGKRNGLCVQEQSFQAMPFRLRIDQFVAVSFIAGKRKTDVLQVYPYLVCAPGLWLTLQQAELAVGSR